MTPKRLWYSMASSRGMHKELLREDGVLGRTLLEPRQLAKFLSNQCHGTMLHVKDAAMLCHPIQSQNYVQVLSHVLHHN
jgi:hypothetical protein